jgi:hypothetical protein
MVVPTVVKVQGGSTEGFLVGPPIVGAGCVVGCIGVGCVAAGGVVMGGVVAVVGAVVVVVVGGGGGGGVGAVRLKVVNALRYAGRPAVA